MLGKDWNHNYEVHLEFTDGEAVLLREDGKEERFFWEKDRYLSLFASEGALEKEKNGLSDEEKTIIELVQAQKSVTRKDVEQVLGCSPSTATRFLSNMVQKDVLLREGKTNGTRYKLRN